MFPLEALSWLTIDPAMWDNAIPLDSASSTNTASSESKRKNSGDIRRVRTFKWKFGSSTKVARLTQNQEAGMAFQPIGF